MDYETRGAKASASLRGGQVSAAEPHPSVELRAMKEGPEPLTSIIYNRRGYHFDRVALAFERLTTALEEAENDGFGFTLSPHAVPTTGRGDVVTQALPIPRTTSFGIESFYTPPI
jgi:hypothetical protein